MNKQIDEPTVDFIYAVGNLFPNEIDRLRRGLVSEMVTSGADKETLGAANEEVKEILDMAADQIDRLAIKYGQGR